jgi:endonuclease G
MVNVAALEAIIQRTGRPPLLIANDEVEIEEGDLDDFVDGTDALITGLNRCIPSVGRVEFFNHRMSWGGTAWVVEKKGSKYLMVTNRHVAGIVAKRIANGSAVFMRSAAGPRYGMNVDFAEEHGSQAGNVSRTVPIAGVEYLADELSADMAVLRVDEPELDLSPLSLAESEAKKGERVALIGYPAFDSRNDVNDQARYFRDLYEVKRLAPGLVLQSLSGQTTLTHDCTSLGGNSGSPLFELEKGTVVGLHFSGLYGVENTAVGITTIKKVLNGVSTLVAAGKAGSEGLADGSHDAAHFNGRKGFNASFLDNGGVRTPWPKLNPDLEAGLAQPSDGPDEPGELRYTHFGVKYSEPHKLPLMTAVNIDGAKAVRIKRGQDKWFVDERIETSIQMGAANFADAQIDRGHMVRREDPNWGSEKEARLANDDTFHYVNAAAQHARLNQGKELWQGLENYILDNSRTHGFQACFTGPVIPDEIEEIDGATVPLEFWKLVATLNADGSKLRATAYLLSQGQLIRDLMERRSRTEAMEGVVLGEYRTFQISIADLAEATGYDFSEYENSDPLAPGPQEAVDRMPRFVALESPDDLILA